MLSKLEKFVDFIVPFCSMYLSTITFALVSDLRTFRNRCIILNVWILISGMASIKLTTCKPRCIQFNGCVKAPFGIWCPCVLCCLSLHMFVCVFSSGNLNPATGSGGQSFLLSPARYFCKTNIYIKLNKTIVTLGASFQCFQNFISRSTNVLMNCILCALP